MTDEQETRVEQFDAPDGPIELDLGIGAGRIDVRLAAESADPQPIQVELKHDPSAGTAWTQGISSTLSWLTEQFGEQLGTDLTASAAAAVQQARVEMVGAKLTVRAPKPLPLRHVPLAVTITAPHGSQVEVRAATARVTVTGTAGRVDVASGSGDVALERAGGPVAIRTGGGAISLGPTTNGLHIRTGGGRISAAEVAGTVSVVTGSGSARIGVVGQGEVSVRSGSGNLAVGEARAGVLDLKSGSGDVSVGVAKGVRAEIDLRSTAGSVSSDLDVADSEPEEQVDLFITARTGTGRAVVQSASG